MKHVALLEQLYDGQLTPEQVYDKITPAFDRRQLKRAHFAKLRIHLPNESRRLNVFMRLLLGFPIPLFIAKFFLKKTNHKSFKNYVDDLTPEDLYQMLRYAKGTTIAIDSDDAKIRIKIR